MKKVLFLTGNGLGDSVMLTPSFAKYQKMHPDTEVHIATLKRFGQTSVELFQGLEYGFNVHPILSDPWEIPFSAGLQRIAIEGATFAKKLEAKTILCNSPHGYKDWRMHKIYRFAEDMGIQLKGDEFKTELGLHLPSFANAMSIGGHNESIVIHISPGNTGKILTKDMFLFVYNYCRDKYEKGQTIIELGSTSLEFSTKINIDDMNLTKALVASASEVIAIDSVVMHIAGAFNKKLISLWTATPIHQALPFWLSLDKLEVHAENEQKTLSNQWKNHREMAIKELGCS